MNIQFSYSCKVIHDCYYLKYPSFSPACSDVNGLGYILSFNMMPMVFVPENFLGDRLSSYSLNFTVSVTIVSAAALKTDTILVRLVFTHNGHH